MKNKVIGNLEYVTSIVPLKVRANTDDPTRIGNAVISKAKVVKAYEPTTESKKDSRKCNHYQKVLEKKDFSGLTREHRKQVGKLLKEESSVFTIDSGDIGHVATHKMEINLRDNNPAQQSYNAISRLLSG